VKLDGQGRSSKEWLARSRELDDFCPIDHHALGKVFIHPPVFPTADVEILIRLSLEFFPDPFLGDPVEQGLIFGVVLGGSDHIEMGYVRHRFGELELQAGDSAGGFMV
jgi:hypothetical protein